MKRKMLIRGLIIALLTVGGALLLASCDEACTTDCRWDTGTNSGTGCQRSGCATSLVILDPPRTVRCNC